MLSCIVVKNLAVAQDITVEFCGGFNVLTGETGAGKSVLIEALGLILGQRAKSDTVRQGCPEASVYGLFQLPETLPTGFAERLGEMGLEVTDSLVIRRIVSPNGRSRVFINGSPATVTMLKGATSGLLEISGQHEHYGLLRDRSGLKLLDAFAGLDDDTKRYRSDWSSYLQASGQLKDLKASAVQAESRADYLRFQIGEIDEASLKVGEEEALKLKRNRLRNRERLTAAFNNAEQTLYEGRDSALSLVGQVTDELSRLSSVFEPLSAIIDELNGARVSLEEAVFSLRGLWGDLEAGGENPETIEERLETIGRICRKHGPTVEEALKRRDEMTNELSTIENRDERIAAAERHLEDLSRSLATQAGSLSQNRQQAATVMSQKIVTELRLLGMPGAEFLIHVEDISADNSEGVLRGFGPDGKDQVSLLFGPNPGEQPAPLAKIASGGELSRVMLGVKRVLSKRDPCLSYVFDEVDAGIGGATANAVGEQLRQVANDRQVICVTHLPQIAALADEHFIVEKKAMDGRTVSQVNRLEGDDRVRELARMLAGRDITPKALAHAEEMVRRQKARAQDVQGDRPHRDIENP